MNAAMNVQDPVAKPRLRPRSVVILAALIVVAVLTHRYWPGDKPVVVHAGGPVPVRVAKVTQQDLPIWVDAIGNVQALNTVNVRVRVDGELQKVLFEEGQTVKAGALLGQIDPRVYQAQVDQAKALVAKDQAQLASLKVNLDRAVNLANAKAGPTQDVDTYRASVAAQVASVQADQAALDNARLQLEFTQVRAPIDGRTGQRLLDVGAIAHGAEATGLVTVTQMNPITVAFAVSQDQLPDILEEYAKGQPLQVLALRRDGSKTLASGKLSFIDSQVAAASGQIQLKAQFDNGQSQLWPGELVSARLLVNTQRGVTVVPVNAVQLGRDGNFVYLLDAEDKVQVRPVKAQQVVDGMQWITSGLQPGETVVTQGQSRIATGVKVTVLPAATTPAVQP
jgi:multidrug efflux system membrane fusion protein